MGNTPVVIDREELLDRFGGDTDFLNETAELFKEDYPSLLEQIRTAIKTGDAGTLERAAHTLKNSVSNFGGVAVREVAYRLEAMGRAGNLQLASQTRLELETKIQEFATALTTVVNEFCDN